VEKLESEKDKLTALSQKMFLAVGLRSLRLWSSSWLLFRELLRSFPEWKRCSPPHGVDCKFPKLSGVLAHFLVMFEAFRYTKGLSIEGRHTRLGHESLPPQAARVATRRAWDGASTVAGGSAPVHRVGGPPRSGGLRRSRWARPNIWRFTILRRLIWPSTGPVDRVGHPRFDRLVVLR